MLPLGSVLRILRLDMNRVKAPLSLRRIRDAFPSGLTSTEASSARGIASVVPYGEMMAVLERK
jgi:hypothetical protein